MVQVEYERVARVSPRKEHGERSGTVERRRRGREPLPRRGEVLVLDDLERRVAQLVGDLPAVAHIDGARVGQPRAGDRVPLRRLADGITQPRGVELALRLDLEVDRP